MFEQNERPLLCKRRSAVEAGKHSKQLGQYLSFLKISYQVESTQLNDHRYEPAANEGSRPRVC